MNDDIASLERKIVRSVGFIKIVRIYWRIIEYGSKKRFSEELERPSSEEFARMFANDFVQISEFVLLDSSLCIIYC